MQQYNGLPYATTGAAPLYSLLKPNERASIKPGEYTSINPSEYISVAKKNITYIFMSGCALNTLRIMALLLAVLRCLVDFR